MDPERRSHREPSKPLTVRPSEITHEGNKSFVAYNGRLREIKRNRVGGGKGFWCGFSWVEINEVPDDDETVHSRKYRPEPGTFTSHSAKND